LPQAQGAGSTIRSTGRLSGSLRGPRGGRALFILGYCRCGDLGFRFLGALRFFQILNGQFELFDQLFAAFRRLAKVFAPRLGQHQLQTLDLEPAGRYLALQQRQCVTLRGDHRVGAGEVARKRIGGVCHA
jgi:hypothetical protein